MTDQQTSPEDTAPSPSDPLHATAAGAPAPTGHAIGAPAPRPLPPDRAPAEPSALGVPPARAPEALGPAVEIVSAGNEVLLGDVLDTNSNWLCQRVTALGGHVRRAVMLRDEVAAIAQELRAAHARHPALIFTVGGLGPTTDDLTLAGVAQAFGRPLELHPEAERMVRERYEEFAARQLVAFSGMNAARRKMAFLPKGAAPLLNRVGGAPGVLAELRDIVDNSCGDLFARLFGSSHYEERSLIVGTQDESAIAHVLAAVETRHPHVYIKSRAQRIGSERVNRITCSARGDDAAAVAALLEPVVDELAQGIGALGIAVHAEDEAGLDPSSYR
jgi:molybdopterin-biosynthesis enzyme MoeA-like protein